MNKYHSPFWTIVRKEVADHVRSWRFLILIGIIALTCMGSLYTALTNIGAAIKPNDPDGSFLFLKLFTVSDGTLPSFTVFVSFLGPLLGIALGFDAINSEQNKGTLSRILSQPIHRDYLINAKFVGALFLGIAFAGGHNSVSGMEIPVWLMLLCSIVMAVGTSIGGEKIIKSVGMNMVKLERYQGFSADLAGAICLLYSSLMGVPVSTTHTKTSAIMGVGAVKRVSAINFGVVKDMMLTWIFTFPGCGLISFS